MSFIGRLGSQEIAVPATQSIIVGCANGAAKVYYGTPAAGGLFNYVLQALVNAGATTFGPFAAGQQVRVEAPAGAEAEYVVGAAPQLSGAYPAAMPTIQMGANQRFLASVSNGLVAKAGGGQAGATLCASDINRFITVATANDSALLPASVPGMEITVTNAAAANSMNLFPAVGDAINALGANAAFAIAAGKSVVLSCAVAGQWHAILSA